MAALNPGAPTRWTDERVARATEILAEHRTMTSALGAMSAEFGFEVTFPAVDSVLRKRGAKAMAYLGSRATQRPSRLAVPPPPPMPRVEIVDDHPADRDGDTLDQPAPHERFAQLVDIVRRATKKGGLDFESLCDELRMVPGDVRALLADARDAGVAVDVAHGRIAFRLPELEPSKPAVAIAPVGHGREHMIGVFSDLHFGSKYCLREQFTAFVRHAYEQGVRDFFCPGDMIEGCYRHAAFERSSESLDDQQTEFLDALPELAGLRVFFIDGNHDFTFTEKTGVEAGRNMMRLARERGRTDLTFFGSRGALIQYGDTRIELWHPKKGAAYALSYQLQNKIRDTDPARLPHILLCGHVHQYVKFRRSNVWAFYAGTFQHGDAPYGRSIGGDVSMGGTIIRWRIDEDNVVRTLEDRFVLAHHEVRRFDVAV